MNAFRDPHGAEHGQDPQHSYFHRLLQQAPSPSPPADFARRMQARVDARESGGALDAWLVGLLLTAMLLAGLGSATPILGKALAGWAVPPLNELAWPALTLAGLAGAWIIDLALRPRLPQAL
ncbi:hypothetical protein [Pseudomarimonas salicorniae]|uniref:Uncharacterized protein n=1 Tax=Pseudomarimonas salicorniae TaxID=2933270 RepID=A0ABT0GIK9_9GAMM|nr:hypothetical protein [Lysobacter sp. CAU 1642]MCK7594376.1 hypothetical protein [Lysobacter sp. CAU 1642]